MSVYAAILSNENQAGLEQYLQAHIDYLADLREQGLVLGNGRLLESSKGQGLVLLRGDSLEAVTALIEQDPFIVHNIKSYELFEWDARWSAVVTID